MITRGDLEAMGYDPDAEWVDRATNLINKQKWDPQSVAFYPNVKSVLQAFADGIDTIFGQSLQVVKKYRSCVKELEEKYIVDPDFDDYPIDDLGFQNDDIYDD